VIAGMDDQPRTIEKDNGDPILNGINSQVRAMDDNSNANDLSVVQNEMVSNATVLRIDLVVPSTADAITTARGSSWNVSKVRAILVLAMSASMARRLAVTDVMPIAARGIDIGGRMGPRTVTLANHPPIAKR
ncbi:MAG TPA: hypothetical protein VFW73_13485, partial [Lacipirellulaceae bacterium]|nr:hypothetical protein [Lacipirellulaceae bacterium]